MWIRPAGTVHILNAWGFQRRSLGAGVQRARSGRSAKEKKRASPKTFDTTYYIGLLRLSGWTVDSASLLPPTHKAEFILSEVEGTGAAGRTEGG